MKAKRAIWYILLLSSLLMIFLSSCSQPPTIVAGTPTTTTTTTPPQEYALGPFIPVGDKIERIVATTTEPVRNCAGHNEPIIKEPSRSTTSSHSVEWSVGGQTGVGATIGEGVIPGGIDLTSSIALTTGKRDIESVTTGNGWQLPSPPGEITTYFIEWKEIWQPGYIEVRVGDKVLYKIDTLVRLEVNSRIVGENSEPCKNSDSSPTEATIPGLSTDPTSPQPPSDQCSSDVYIREKGNVGDKKTYVRCPTGEVEYVIQPDDMLLSIRYKCPDGTDQLIGFHIDDALSSGEQLPIYRSDRFISKPGCYVEIAVQNSVADLMGYTIRREVVGQPKSMPSFPTNVGSAEARGSCGSSAFGGNLYTANPEFLRPDGHKSGWISSDPATVILPNGKQIEFPTQFVLIVEDLPYVQIRGVGRNTDGLANVWGCWFLENDAELIEESARIDFQRKVDAHQKAVLYRVDQDGIQLLAQNNP